MDNTEVLTDTPYAHCIACAMMENESRKNVGGILLWGLFAVFGFGGFALFPQWPLSSSVLEKMFGLKQRPNGPYATTDLYLSALGVPRPSERVLELFSEIPESEGIIFVGSGEDPNFALNHYVFSYLSWPRKLGALDCRKANEGLFYPTSDREKIRWMIYYRKLPPREMESSARTLGSNLWLIPIKELRDWKYYCSR